MKELQLASLVDMYNPYSVMKEVKNILSLVDPDYGFGTIDRIFKDMIDLFMGRYPGFRGCNCTYHDLLHTTDTFLAMTRLIHGAVLRGNKFTKKKMDLGISSALLHDTGFIQEKDDTQGTGAKYTLIHIDRSIRFASNYLKKLGFSENDTRFVASILRCTGINVKIETVKFFSKEHEMLGKMLGTADLIGQMGSRVYLEKLPYLYQEFKEGNVPGYKDEVDLIIKTIDFYRWTLKRFKNEFGSVYQFMKEHFKERWGINENLYITTIEKNMHYLEHILKEYPEDYKAYFRRRLPSYEDANKN